MHAVLGQPLAAHRLERTGTDMQCQPCLLDAARMQAVQQVGREVKARGWRCNCTRPRGVNSLVALGVGSAVGVRDVRRQWHAALPFEDREHVVVEPQLEEVVAPAFDNRFDTRIEHKPAAAGWLVAGAYQRQRERRFQHALHQHFDLAAARLAAEKPRLDHARVVEDEQVIAIEQFNDVAEVTVGEAPVGNVQQAARGAIGQRMLRDQSRG